MPNPLSCERKEEDGSASTAIFFVLHHFPPNKKRNGPKLVLHSHDLNFVEEGSDQALLPKFSDSKHVI